MAAKRTGGKAKRRAEDEYSPAAALAQRAARVAAGLIVVAMGAAWAMGVEPMRDRVSSIRSDPITVEFDWPRSDPRTADGTWVPEGVRRGLKQLVHATVSLDPFDVASLETARAELEATGWFAELDSVRRLPDARVRVEGDWRVPAAVVERGSSWWLVGMDGAPMRLPDGSGAPSGLFRIYQPMSGPQRAAGTGRTAYGQTWPDDDVTHAIELLSIVAGIPEADAIVGVDLRRYATQGWLSLVTDTGCELVWGAPLAEPSPSEAETARKLQNVREVLDPGMRLDRGHGRVEVMTDYVFVDRSATGTGRPAR